jgi:hypothetical protein
MGISLVSVNDARSFPDATAMVGGSSMSENSNGITESVEALDDIDGDLSPATCFDASIGTLRFKSDSIDTDRSPGNTGVTVTCASDSLSPTTGAI